MLDTEAWRLEAAHAHMRNQTQIYAEQFRKYQELQSEMKALREELERAREHAHQTNELLVENAILKARLKKLGASSC